MNPTHTSLGALCAMMLAIQSASGELVIDLDPATAGIQSTTSALTGTTITAQIVYVPTVAVPAFTGFGLDINWITTGTAASTTPASLVAGDYAGFVPGPTDNHLLGGVPLVPGTPLVNHGLPSPIVGASNIGGGAIEDFPAPVPIAPLGPLNLAGAMFTVTGAPGDTISFTPSGILSGPGASLMFFGGPGSVAGGSPFQNTASDMAIADTFLTSTVTITAVPEPSSCALVLVGLIAGLRRRRRV